jgi:poly(A) polymerase
MIRAVKYGASTGFRLSFSLKWKIRKQSSLLEGISASRLTEEINKIVRSSQAAAIVASLDAMGLYRYLQPRAAELFKTNAGFREQYLKTMGTLNQADFKNLPGEALAGLVRDYLEENADWDGEEDGQTVKPPSERYKEAFALARQFVLPMNPPRMELDHGVRLLFAEHGVIIKKSRFTERQGRRGPEVPLPTDADSPPSTDEPPKRRRRRRHKPRKETPESQE